MTATILDGAGWVTLGLFAFVFLAALGALIHLSYRYFRNKPTRSNFIKALGLAHRNKPAPRRDYADERLTQMSKHRADVAEHFGQKHHH